MHEDVYYDWKKKNIAIYELQRYLGVNTPTSIYLWIRGEYIPNAATLVKLAYIFGCTVDDILVTEVEE